MSEFSTFRPLPSLEVTKESAMNRLKCRRKKSNKKLVIDCRGIILSGRVNLEGGGEAKRREQRQSYFILDYQVHQPPAPPPQWVIKNLILAGIIGMLVA